MMTMDDTWEAYKTFIEILASRRVTHRHIVLAAEMIKADAEINSFLAGMKKKVPRGDWIDFADRLEKCEIIYEVAWAKFKENTATDGPTTEAAIDELEDAFQRAADSMCSVVEDTQQYEERYGESG